MQSDVPPPAAHEDEATAARALRAKGRRWVVTLGANALLFGVMLGGPYVRGHVRTRSLWPRFAEAAACVLGGEPAGDPGLGLPHGAPEAFAAQVLAAEAGWPARCDGPLDALALPPVTFLLPGVKTAELDLQATVELLERELEALPARPQGTRVPMRPLLALEKLRAALARHAQAAGVLQIPDENAIDLPPGDEAPAATRVPLYAGADAEVRWSGDADSLTLLALDRRGLSFVRVEEGGLVERRDSRPGRLRAMAGDPASGVTLVWHMPPTTCDDREDACATKSVGVAPLALPFEGMPEPRWLAAHPAGRGDRDVHRDGDRVQVLASTRADAVVVREFELPASEAPEPNAPPMQARSQWPEIDGADDGLLLAGAGALGHGTAGAERVAFWLQAAGQPPRALGTLPGEGGWSLACPSGLAGAFGTEHSLRLWRSETGLAAEPWLSPALHVPLQADLHDEWPSRDRIRVVCTGEGEPVWIGRAEGDLLTLVRCTDRGCDKELVASEVQFFDAAAVGEGRLLVAHAGSGERAQVMSRGVRIGDEVAFDPPNVPDPCWEGGGGLCGLPRLLVAGDRVLLGAREGTDMRVMESRDGGRHWTPMHGLRKAAAQR